MGQAVVRRVTMADTAMARALRLEMLADAPLAFIETIDQAAARPHAHFRARLAEKIAGNFSAQFVAEADGRLVGQAGGFRAPGTTGVTLVFSVYVTPVWRGTGLLARLVEAVADWLTKTPPVRFADRCTPTSIAASSTSSSTPVEVE